MILSSCGCKVSWALRGGNGECGFCGSLGRSRRYTVSSTTAWVPSSPHVLCCTAAAHSQGVATPWLTISRSADRPMGTGDAGDRDGRDACDGILQSTIFTVAIVAIVATVALSLFERRYVCLCQGYAPPSVLGSILITHPIFVQKSATFHIQILGQCIRRKL